QQIIEMHEQDILQLPVVPPALRMCQVRKEWIAIVLPGKAPSVEPGVKGRVQMRRRQRHGVADTAGRGIDLLDAFRAHVVPVLTQRHEHVEAVTPYEDVLNPVAEGEAIEGQVRFDIAPMPQALQERQSLRSWGKARIQPR